MENKNKVEFIDLLMSYKEYLEVNISGLKEKLEEVNKEIEEESNNSCLNNNNFIEDKRGFKL